MVEANKQPQDEQSDPYQGVYPKTPKPQNPKTPVELSSNLKSKNVVYRLRMMEAKYLIGVIYFLYILKWSKALV